MNVKDIERRLAKGYGDDKTQVADIEWLINEVKRLRNGIDNVISDIPKEDTNDPSTVTKIQKKLVDVLYNQ
jgi:hypothetical protein